MMSLDVLLVLLLVLLRFEVYRVRQELGLVPLRWYTVAFAAGSAASASSSARPCAVRRAGVRGCGLTEYCVKCYSLCDCSRSSTHSMHVGGHYLGMGFFASIESGFDLFAGVLSVCEV